MSGKRDGHDRPPLLMDGEDGGIHHISVSVVLTGEQAAAVEGWRVANRIDSQPEAVRELVRIGLLSEIGRIYRMIAGGRDSEDDDEDFADGRMTHGRRGEAMT